jgi:hypothetical protein
MRIDITQIVRVCVMNGIKPNYSKCKCHNKNVKKRAFQKCIIFVTIEYISPLTVKLRSRRGSIAPD